MRCAAGVVKQDLIYENKPFSVHSQAKLWLLDNAARAQFMLYFLEEVFRMRGCR